MLVLYTAEIVGASGIDIFKKGIPALKSRYAFDFVVAAADGATHGGGLGLQHAGYLHKLGANVITLGDFCFYKKDLTQNLGKLPYVLRPFNLVKGAPGTGAAVFNTRSGKKIAVVSALGQAGFAKLHAENPFEHLPPLLDKLREQTPYIIVDFHALATAEKKTLAALARDKCSALIGSHTRVQSADNYVTPSGMAYISDAGRTGSIASVAGLEPENVINEYLRGIPSWQREAVNEPRFQGAFIKLDDAGKAISIERINLETKQL